MSRRSEALSDERPVASSQEQDRGRLVILAGPAGVGKSTVVHELRKQHPELWFSVSATTREPRPGEIDGRDYHFVTAAEFDRMIADGELLEWAEIHGGLHRSGTPRKPIEERMAAGKPALVEVDVQGARALRKALPEATLVFLTPPSWDEMERRLLERGTETPDHVQQRLETAKDWFAAQDEFDVVLVNADVHQVVTQLIALLTEPVH